LCNCNAYEAVVTVPVIPPVTTNEPVISTWLPAAKIKLDLEEGPEPLPIINAPVTSLAIL
jgi:hypothetical protein